ncbi:hypothetical protein IFM89_006399 [Coptis chinensis]|uniref:aspartyl aminopeptidase n=1 Tax=Coptis chinensis TaxID=261450 RepID=A0A835LR40_9MAGN|nr:hypothetical protein IFM89_006399 [Coptis chinensis]
MSSLVAFAIGQKYNVGSGFHVIAAHTDSSCLKLKLKFCEVELLTLVSLSRVIFTTLPKSASLKSGYHMVNVQTYGGGFWHTWFDRDLSVAGRLF